MEDFSEQQLFFMRRAIELGEKGKISAPPNPWVGCVFVKDHRIIGEGYHKAKGQPHAEVEAANAARESLEGADVYVTLEPCCHYGSTPPCVDLLIRHKVSAVYIGVRDPDPLVSGKGIAALKEAGITVYEGVAQQEVKKSLRPYLYQRTYKQPWVIVKSAASIDGQVADRGGLSQWITCSKARENVGKVRAESQAIIVGSTTVLMDNPALTARYASGELYERQPLRVVIDGKGRVSPQAKVFHHPEQTLLVTTSQCSKDKLESFQFLGIPVLIADSEDEKVDLHQVYAHLASLHILQVLVEGGSGLHTAFLQKDLAHELIFYVGAKILGDQGKPLFRDMSIGLSNAIPLTPLDNQILGESLKCSWGILSDKTKYFYNYS